MGTQVRPSMGEVRDIGGEVGVTEWRESQRHDWWGVVAYEPISLFMDLPQLNACVGKMSALYQLV